MDLGGRVVRHSLGIGGLKRKLKSLYFVSAAIGLLQG